MMKLQGYGPRLLVFLMRRLCGWKITGGGHQEHLARVVLTQRFTMIAVSSMVAAEPIVNLAVIANASLRSGTWSSCSSIRTSIAHERLCRRRTLIPVWD